MADRFRFRTFLREGCAEGYEAVHAAIPVELDAVMRAAGVRQWRITRRGLALDHDVEAEYRPRMDAVLDADPVNAAWQREVAPFLAESDPEEDTGADTGLDGAGYVVWQLDWPTR